METDSAAASGTVLAGGGGGAGAGVAVTEVAPTQTMLSEEPKLLPASVVAAPLAPAVAAAPVSASATTTTTTMPPGEDHAIDATTYGIQQQQQQQQQPVMMVTEQQQPQQKQQQLLPQAQPLMLKVTAAGTKDKEKSHKRKKNMDSAGQGPPPTAVVKAENTPDVSAAVTGDLRDEDDDNDEDDDRLLMQEYDPERLKAFNMFVRLFVDENLDRVAPISKQPKEKIQAILEACDRQFPEFHHRSRKRIRTYLKSCRRMRRSKGVGDGKQIRPTLPHLTSAAAETILARACENESNNAKRMRMGLEPLPATEMVMASGQAPVPALPPPPPPPAPPAPVAPAPPPATPAPPTIAPQPMPNPKSSSPRSKMSLSPHSTAVAITPGIPLPLQKPLELTSQTGSRASPLAHAQPKPAPPIPMEMAHSSPMRQPSLKVAHRPVEQDHVLMQSATLRGALPESELPLAYVTNGSGGKAHVGHTFEREIHPFQNEAYPGSASSVLQSNEQQQNGPTDLSMKKEAAPLSKSHLNPEEVATIKQLIAGYRESAAFLCRSADELQQLIMQHN